MNLQLSKPTQLLSVATILALLGTGLSAFVTAQSASPVETRLACFARYSQDPLDVGTMEHFQLPGMAEPVHCWGHFGHHTYFLGTDRVHHLKSIRGEVIASELAQIGSQAGVSLLPMMEKGLRVEISLDGLTWTEVGRLELSHWTENLDPLIPETSPELFGVSSDLPDGGFGYYDGNFPGNTVRYVAFADIQGHDEAFRFVRFRVPVSSSLGLSGYLDGTGGDNVGFNPILVDSVPDAAPLTPQLVSKTQTLRCQDRQHMEDFLGMVHGIPGVSVLPCTFGGLNYFDSASSYHTYFLNDARLDRISGKVTLNLYRSTGATPLLTNTLSHKFYVQTSNDGREWTTIGSQPYVPGVESSFDFAGLGGLPAKFVRFLGDPHPDGYGNLDQGGQPCYGCWFTLGYFLSSEVTVTGQLPE